jgi:hypothetical protein
MRVCYSQPRETPRRTVALSNPNQRSTHEAMHPHQRFQEECDKKWFLFVVGDHRLAV